MNPLISVIVPAYNAEKTIGKCLNSIQKQTYSNLQVIVINDGSTDNTEKTVTDLQSKDKRIELISIENNGVSHARNVGIDHAKGEYITFVDSDDYIDSNMYESLMDIVQRFSVKIAHCSYKNVDTNGNLLSVVGDHGRIVEQDHDTAMTCLITGHLFAGGLWNKLYYYELFNSCRLEESIKFNEDILMNANLFDQVEKSVYIDKPFYNYVSNPYSATHSANIVEAQKQRTFVSNALYSLSKKKRYEKEAENRMAHELLNLYRAYILQNDRSLAKEKQLVILEVQKYKAQGFYNNKKDKFLLFSYRYMPLLFLLLYRIYDKVRVKKLDPEQ